MLKSIVWCWTFILSQEIVLGHFHKPLNLTANCFPEEFLFGTATAAYQVEGGWNLTGREPSIWDDFCRRKPGVACANVADDMIHRYPSDIKLMKAMGLNAFRFSISWSRVMKWNVVTKQFEPNEAGIVFYQNFIHMLRENDLEPILTLYHWDLPLPLHQEFLPPGWLNAGIVEYFTNYASLMFLRFGKDIKYWTTFNEPHSFTTQGYGTGNHAPGMANSSTNVYIAGHNVLLSHASAVSKFRELKEKGSLRADARISIVLNFDYAFPLDVTNTDDVEAAKRSSEFMLGWWLKPITQGDYPNIMKEIVGDRLPSFTPEQKTMLLKSYDLFMLNHYSSKLATNCNSKQSQTPCHTLAEGWERDLGVDRSHVPEGARLSSMTNGKHNCEWFTGYPKGYLPAIRWMHKHDRDADILLTENGWCGNATVDNEDQLWYFQKYLTQVIAGLNEGIPIIGYTAWSFVDNYEWGSFVPRFGLHYVEYPPEIGSSAGFTPSGNDLERIPRPAAYFIANVSTTKCIPLGDFPSKWPEIIGKDNFWRLGMYASMLLVFLFAAYCFKQCCCAQSRSGYTPVK